MPTASAPTPILASNIRAPLGTPDPTMVQSPAPRSTPAFMLDTATDDVFNSMDATQLRQFIHDARPSSVTIFGATTPSVNLLPSFASFSSSSTPEMDQFLRSISSVGMVTHLGSLDFLDFLDSQGSFDSVFGQNPVMIRVSKRAVGT